MPRPKTYKRKPEIYRTVARLFARRGYDRTSVRDITRELGMSKSSLYYYFTSKEEVLFNLMDDCMDHALEVIESICRSDLPPTDKIREVFHFYASFYLSDMDRLTLLVNEINALNDPYRDILIAKERRYVQLLRGILNELEQEGELRPVNPSAAVFAFFGMVHWAYRWYRPDGPVTPDQVAHEFLEIFTRGVLKGTGPDTGIPSASERG